MKQLVQQLRYKAWANEALYTALSKIPVDVVEAKRKIVFGSITRTLNHAYTMDLVWRAHLEGKSHGYVTRNPGDCPSLESLQSLQREADTWFIEYLESISAQRAAQTVEFEFIGGGAGCMTRFEILFHVVNHGTYHRGHVAAMMYETGNSPPTTDFPVFLRANNTET